MKFIVRKLSKIKTIFVILVFSFYIVLCAGQSSSTNTSANSSFPTLQPDWSYCYDFTWFGPDYDNVTQYNGTCQDYLDETRATDVPCAAPIVISFDGTPPDMDYLWDNYRNSILCKRSRNQVCVKYTYFFNNQVNNVTHMCAKVQSLNTDSGITSGCFKQKSGAYETEVCVCKSGPGIYPPCNNSFTSTVSISMLLILVVMSATNFIQNDIHIL